MADNYKKIRDLISIKVGSSSPVYPMVNQSAEPKTDKFAYPSWYRGDPTSSSPMIAEREAGWRPKNESDFPAFMHINGRSSGGYLKTPVINTEEEALKSVNGPAQYFQTSCSTVFPYYSKEEKTDQTRMFDTLNKSQTYMLSHR